MELSEEGLVLAVLENYMLTDIIELLGITSQELLPEFPSLLVKNANPAVSSRAKHFTILYSLSSGQL